MESFLKKQLFETGYISFKLKEFDEKIYNSLKVLFPPGSLNPKQFNNLKASIIKRKNNDIDPKWPNVSNGKFEELEEIKKEIIKNYNNDLNNSYGLDQIWYFDWPYDPKCSKTPHSEILNPIFKYFYDVECNAANSQITMYNDGCFLINHRDGDGGYTGDRKCAILIYLSTDYENGKGGEMVLSKDKNNEEWIEPIYGNVAIFDFTKHNIWHRVEKINGYNRYCYINFC